MPARHTLQTLEPEGAYHPGEQQVLACTGDDVENEHEIQLVAPAPEYLPDGQAVHGDAPSRE